MKTTPLSLTAAALAISLALPAFAQELQPGGEKMVKPDISKTGGVSELAPGTKIEGAAPDTGVNPLNPRLLPGSQRAKQAIEKLTPKQREDFQNLLQEANRLMGAERVMEAIEKLVEAEILAEDIPIVHNLKGACYTKIRDFKRARESFAKTLELAPDFFQAEFNRAEIEFVSKEYAEARKQFQGMLEKYPKIAPATKSLVEFKIFLCEAKLGETEKAKAYVAATDPLAETPEYYFGKAALSFMADDKAEANGWLESARRIYSAQLNAIFLDSLIELGWIDKI